MLWDEAIQGEGGQAASSGTMSKIIRVAGRLCGAARSGARGLGGAEGWSGMEIETMRHVGTTSVGWGLAGLLAGEFECAADGGGGRGGYPGVRVW